ncbi:unnamed protein product [Chilo suppressalis]|uniref:PH domain-containing protein n=1 Tax=Chilo suppressalis TaxID=168631 RepID=A0ABN8B1C4_CHISP|nr:hypothetical protein evm_012858 [Chilo suppressalis]CAH0401969.1 unnamed protein product [Chilo suppressalis]
MSRNIVFEGWLTKSPPSKRIWRTKWRRRWFALRQSGELPGQYFLDYYADRNYRRLKGTINLDLCEQVDAGLHMERSGNGSLDPKVRGSVFTIQTQSRIYHLEADCKSDMEKWVDAICRVCGLRATDESDEIGHYQNNVNANNVSALNEQKECADTTGPYIPISECRTGVRAQDSQRAFTFDPKNIITSARHPLERMAEYREHHMYTSQPQIRLNNQDSENDSTLSDEECKSLNASQSNIHDYSVSKTFTKLTISPEKDELPEDGPPVPPRPPKTFSRSKELFYKETYQGPKFLEPPDTPDPSHGLRVSRRKSQGAAPPSPVRGHLTPCVVKIADEEEEYPPNYQSMQYCNLASLPPAVDRNLKPRPQSHSMAPVFAPAIQTPIPMAPRAEPRSDTLQYLDLDLMPKSSPIKTADGRRRDIIHGKSYSAADADCAYKTVDFLKTEAFNITRQDAEALRNSHY